MMRQPTRTSKYRRRKGYTLVIFAMLLFALFALAALVIDLGLVRLTQRQMQTAVDSAALEGLRFRDGVPAAWVDEDTSNDPPFITGASPHPPLPQSLPEWEGWYDEVRRRAVSDLVARQQAFDFDQRDETIATMESSPQIDPAFTAMLKRGIYHPELRQNTDNLASGDMVAGIYDPNGSHTESDTFLREDFAANTGTDAFLVRMRRSNRLEDSGLDPEVGSAGPPLPYLFAHPAILGGETDLVSKQHYQKGVTIRSTTISQTQKAKSVGVARLSDRLPGVLPITIFASSWNLETPLPIDTEIEIVADSGTISVNTIDVGFAVGFSHLKILGDQEERTNLTQPELANTLREVVSEEQKLGYVSIISTEAGPLENRIIGFGIAHIRLQGNSVFLTRFAGRIASENVSASLIRQFDEYFRNPANATHLHRLLGLHDDDVQFRFPLLAPALVR
ncbi:hypothetical protein ETAA8_21210 [Anatilimnocola aggregata]|uniref:Putative Flp pilus-assembly TadG-like N-terminal domain-containing protein n=1 Tax=Anatilimnocola aggregata TaxID=2528021 RepID=A0A517Y9X3_9BACT|nr:Tad domain-containing protein [Anatilimnocola aggregata]QDU27037.1 hypothetical protein ETAA8_21210 [Anatilimnocola aggregata]